jgi:hypothetical protein
MFYNLRKKLSKAWFDCCCSGIKGTSPVLCDSSSELVVVSQLYHPDVVMYLLAAKSLARYLSVKEFVIVDDGLSIKDKSILLNNFSSIRFIPRKSVSVGKCPVGACWERLLTLAELSQDSYVIQLDSDTLMLNDPVEVRACIAEGRSFTLGTATGRHFVSLDEASHLAFTRDPEHVQILAERAFGEYPDREQLKYVRGCAGFSGFARKHLSTDAVQEFSVTMEKLLGKDAWCQWGSEQVASNFMVANAPHASVLPMERYPFWMPGVNIEGAALVHFLGTFRFSEGTYSRQARGIIDVLLQ